MIFMMLVLGYVFLAGTNSWAYTYKCQILQILYHSDGIMVHVNPGVTETGFTEKSRVFLRDDAESKRMVDMMLSAASGNMEIIVSLAVRISWEPQIVNALTIVVSDVDSVNRTTYHGPVFLERYSADHNGSYFFVSDPKKLPENAVALRVPSHEPALASLMISAFNSGKQVLVAVSNRWTLASGDLAWTIYAAKFAYGD